MIGETVVKKRLNSVENSLKSVFLEDHGVENAKNLQKFLQNPLDKFICLVYNVNRPKWSTYKAPICRVKGGTVTKSV